MFSLSDLSMRLVLADPGGYDRMSKWLVFLKKGDSFEQEFEYSMGCAHRVWAQTVAQREHSAFGTIRKGERVQFRKNLKKDSRVNIPIFQWFEKNTRPIQPKLEDILECLIMDIQASQGSFDDFCDEFGYDSDSRKAFSIWEKCCENNKKLRSLGIPLTEETLELVRGEN